MTVWSTALVEQRAANFELKPNSSAALMDSGTAEEVRGALAPIIAGIESVSDEWIGRMLNSKAIDQTVIETAEVDGEAKLAACAVLRQASIVVGHDHPDEWDECAMWLAAEEQAMSQRARGSSPADGRRL